MTPSAEIHFDGAADDAALPFPDLRRVDDEYGSHIEPPIDRSWPELEQLHWWAAVARIDSGIRITVHAFTGRFDGEYGLQVGRHSLSSMPFRDAWQAISSMSIGAESARDRGLVLTRDEAQDVLGEIWHAAKAAGGQILDDDLMRRFETFVDEDPHR